MKIIVRSLMIGAVMALIPVIASGAGFDLQARIDAARPGEVIEVPAGTYTGSFQLREGVILQGAGFAAAALRGTGKDPVLRGAYGAIVQGFTITGGIEGIKTNGAQMGIFENVIRGNRGSGVMVGGGECLLLNNIIVANGGRGAVETARGYVEAVGNTLSGGPAALSFWKSPESRVAFNLIAASPAGISRDEDSFPEISGNVFWENELEIDPAPLPDDNFSLDPLVNSGEDGDWLLSADSPLREMPASGLPAGLRITTGSSLPAGLSPADYRGLFRDFRERRLLARPLVTYELLDKAGEFRVTTSFPDPNFTVTSSTGSTPIRKVESYDTGTAGDLPHRLDNSDPEAVEVWGWGGEVYPSRPDRYVMESVFSHPESYIIGTDDSLTFRRRTNFARISLLIPEGYQPESVSPEAEVDPEAGVISFSNPRQKMIEIRVRFLPAE